MGPNARARTFGAYVAEHHKRRIFDGALGQSPLDRLQLTLQRGVVLLRFGGGGTFAREGFVTLL